MGNPITQAVGRNTIFGFVFALFVLAGMEVLSFLLIGVANRVCVEPIRRTPDIYREQSDRIRSLLSPHSREVPDSVVGWRYRAGYRTETDHINSQGLRSERVYAVMPSNGIVRVAAFGDSFVYCNEVANKDAWPFLIEMSLSDLEVLNFGVGGYGTDQAYLLYKVADLARSADVVVIGFAPTDLRRVVNVYRRFYSSLELPLFKPRFTLAESHVLALIPCPVRGESDYLQILKVPCSVTQWGRYDQWYQSGVYNSTLYDLSALARLCTVSCIRIHNRYIDPDRPYRGREFNPSCMAFRLQMEILARFADEVKSAGQIPIVVIFPEKESVQRAAKGMTTTYAPLVLQLRQRKVDCLDLIDGFTAGTSSGRGTDELFRPGGHYSRQGNEIVATRVARWVREATALRIRDLSVRP